MNPKNRFGKKESGFSPSYSLLLSMLFFFFTLYILFVAFGNIEKGSKAEQLKSLEMALRRSVVQCYALEGRYPPDLSYLEDNYGLQVNHDKYIVHYQNVGGNLLPEISIFPHTN